MRIPIVFAFFLCFSPLFGQKPSTPTSSDIYQQIKKLNVLGSVLYVAAHPDDENQRLISYFANKKLYDVTYLSLTRGDGGQNLIGPEIRELLGVLRTEELLAARRVDGGQQLFSRANDFGYSKDPNETLRIWDKELVLEDVVRAFRSVQPDVVVNRFDHHYNTKTHGHHTTSAMLSVEAFDKAADARVFPEMADELGIWQAKRAFLNTSYWFYGGKEAFEKVDKSNFWAIDVGVFLPLRGKSNNEIAAEARSQHRCQGFGSAIERGENIDYLDFIKGSKPSSDDIFEGINTSWNRLKGGASVGVLLERIAKNFDLENPAASVPALMDARALIQKLPDSFWKNKKLKAIEQVIFDCSGLFLEAFATESSATAGDSVTIRFEALNRSATPILLENVVFFPNGVMEEPRQQLHNNQTFSLTKTMRLEENQRYTAPYWLMKKGSLGMYSVSDESLLGKPNSPHDVTVSGTLGLYGKQIAFEREVVFKKVNPAIGEIYQPFEITPPLFVEFQENLTLIRGESAKMTAKITAGKANISGKLYPTLPEGWRAEPASFRFDLGLKNSSQSFVFTVFPPKNAEVAEIGLRAEPDNFSEPGIYFSKKRALVEYEHVPLRTVLLPSEVRVAPLDVRILARKIAYFQGAGDAVPDILRQLGCSVDLLTDADLTAANLKQYDALVFGVRAYNTQEHLKFVKNELLDYVQQGGTMVVQYNTPTPLVEQNFTPYPIHLSTKDRVTEEDAPVKLLLPEHRILSFPNKITEKDFDGWVQERGLYFADEWAAEWDAPLSMADTGYEQSAGSLLVAKYGQGHYVYTGLSLFRELPAGVPGAIRLFANLISLKDLP